MSQHEMILPISLRAFAVPTAGRPKSSPGQRPPLENPSRWSVIFDTETTVDAGHALRFGTYQVRECDQLRERGLFYAAQLSAEELAVLSSYAEERGLRLITHADFVQKVLFRYGYDRRGSIIGFNLPFDISRIAIKHGEARGKMYGGFSFTLSADRRLPTIRVKHLSRRASLISFAAPWGQRTPRNMRERGERMPKRTGFFVDIGTIAAALLSRGFSLQSLSEFLKVEHPKLSTDEHGGKLTPEYLDYAVNDVQTTWECYVELTSRYERLGLTETPLHKIFSEASLGKAYLKAMGVKPWRELQPDVPHQLIANILSTYFGGRSEVRIRRHICQVVLCDFLSMYPTVNTLMGLWSFVTADGMRWRDATSDTRALLASVVLADLQVPAFWRKLRVLVRIKSHADVVPVRAQYSDTGAATIGLNQLTSDTPLWFTLADCIASKLLNGAAPEIVEAIAFEPGDVQSDLRPVSVAGNPTYRVNPRSQDFYRRLIELRQETKQREKEALCPDEKNQLSSEQLALKIAANATSYGISVEVNVQEKAKKTVVDVYHSSGNCYEVETFNQEEPGRYFHPLLATLITGAARLMLAVTERLVLDHGLNWAFCDTDSMAIARPEEMDEREFYRRVGYITSWFEALNPYGFPGSILKIEDVNFRIGSKNEHEPLYCWAVSAKRYALFNIDTNGSPNIRKASAHGLGHLLAPYSEENRSPSIPHPVVQPEEIGVELWQHDLWWSIVTAALQGHPDQLDLSFHPALEEPAFSRYGATSPRLLNWFKGYNANRSYPDQVKPFGFLLCPFNNPQKVVVRSGRRARKLKPIRPVAVFDRDLARAADGAFDRETSQSVTRAQLKTYRQALAQYHLHSEDKFENGASVETGITRRRHIRACGIANIGKEANRWEEQFHLGLDEDAEINYATAPEAPRVARGEIRSLASAMGIRNLAEKLGLSRGSASKLIKGDLASAQKVGLATLMKRLRRASEGVRKEREAVQATRAKISELIERIGLGAAALELGADPSNLLKVAQGKRAPTERTVLYFAGGERAK